jgi:hypothetical protein
MKRSLTIGAGLVAGFLLAEPARAELRSDWSVNKATHGEWDGGYDIQSERRDGFVASISLGFGAAAGSGYPNEVAKIDDPDYKTTTGLGFGSVNTIWVGGALRDWFVFGLGIWGMSVRKDDYEGVGGGFMARIETFPLWSLGGAFRDLSVYTNLGPGGFTIEGGREKADGGLVSLLSLGTSYELFRLKYFAVGPALEGLYLYSQSAQSGGAFLGVKGTVYTAP